MPHVTSYFSCKKDTKDTKCRSGNRRGLTWAATSWKLWENVKHLAFQSKHHLMMKQIRLMKFVFLVLLKCKQTYIEETAITVILCNYCLLASKIKCILTLIVKTRKQSNDQVPHNQAVYYYSTSYYCKVSIIPTHNLKVLI